MVRVVCDLDHHQSEALARKRTNLFLPTATANICTCGMLPCVLPKFACTHINGMGTQYPYFRKYAYQGAHTSGKKGTWDTKFMGYPYLASERSRDTIRGNKWKSEIYIYIYIFIPPYVTFNARDWSKSVD